MAKLTPIYHLLCFSCPFSPPTSCCAPLPFLFPPSFSFSLALLPPSGGPRPSPCPFSFYPGRHSLSCVVPLLSAFPHCRFAALLLVFILLSPSPSCGPFSPGLSPSWLSSALWSASFVCLSLSPPLPYLPLAFLVLPLLASSSLFPSCPFPLRISSPSPFPLVPIILLFLPPSAFPSPLFSSPFSSSPLSPPPVLLLPACFPPSLPFPFCCLLHLPLS